MGRRIRIWFHPSVKKQDFVSAGGWGIDEENSQVSLCYRNTEIMINFNDDAIEVNTYSSKGDGEIGRPLETKKLKYSGRKDRPDCDLERYQSHVDISRAEKPHIKADMRHCIVFVSGKKKSKKKKVKS